MHDATIQSYNQSHQSINSVSKSTTQPSSQGVDEYALQDPYLWLLKDQAFDGFNEKTHRFWEIQSVERQTLPPSTLLSPLSLNYEEAHVLKRYRFGSERPVFEVQMRVFIRPIAFELLTELINLELLDADWLSKQSTFELEFAQQTWRADQAVVRKTQSGRTLLCTPL